MTFDNDVVAFAEVKEVRAERFDRLLFLETAVDADHACAAAKAVLDGLLPEFAAGADNDKPVVGFEGSGLMAL